MEQPMPDSSDSLLTSDTNECNGGSHKPRTRRTTELFGIGPAVSIDDATITGCRLPTCLQVLRCMMYHCNMAANTERPGAVGAISRFTTAKLVLQQVATVYEKANIPMVSQRRCCDKIVKLLDDNNKLRAICKDRRDTPATKRRLEESQRMLASTFQLWPPNVETMIKNEEDRSFLQSMKTDRAASFGPFDKLLAQKVARRNRRAAAAAEQLKRERLDNVSTTTVSSNLPTDSSDSDHHDAKDSDIDNSEDGDPVAKPTASLSRRKKLTGTSVMIPPDVLSKPNIVSLATRLKMTPTQQAAFTQGLISESGGAVSMVASSILICYC